MDLDYSLDPCIRTPDWRCWSAGTGLHVSALNTVFLLQTTITHSYDRQCKTPATNHNKTPIEKNPVLVNQFVWKFKVMQYKLFAKVVKKHGII